MKKLPIILGLLLCFSATPARADEPTEAERSAARELVWEGDQFFEKREYEQALSNYSSAYRLVKVPTVGIGIAKSLAALGRLREALASAEEVANLPAQAGEHPAFSEARSDARRLADDLTARIPVVTLVIQPKLPDAEVRIDGAPLPKGNTGGHWRLDPGQHSIQVSAPGYLPKTQELELAERAQQRLDFALTPLTPAAQPLAPTSPALVPAADGSASALDPATAESRAASARTRAYVALSIAGAAAAAGTVTGIMAFQTKPDCPEDECDASYQDELDNSLLYGNIANVSVGVAAVLGIYGLYEYFANGSVEAPEAASAAGLSLSPHGVSVSLSGAF